MQMSRADRECIGMLVREARMQERAAQLRALAVDRWTRAWCEQERGRGITGREPEAAVDPIDAALTVLESDLSYLEELPTSRVAPSGAAIAELDERMKSVIALLKGTS